MIRGAVVGLALVVVGCGDDGSPKLPDAFIVDADLTAPDAMPREVITATQTLQPLELVEGIMNGGPEDYAGIHLEGVFPKVSWNIHGHENGGTQIIYEEFDKMEVNHIFIPTSKTDWWLLIRNDGQTTMDVSVRVELYGDMTWRWQ